MVTRFLWQGMSRTLRLFVLLVLAIGILVPLSNLLLPPGSAFRMPSWAVQLVGKYLCYASLALAVDLVWGFCGILTLGHAAFFALGGYCMGMYLMRQIGTRGVYGNPILPDFMVFLNYKELPWFWHGFDSFWFAAPMIVLVPSVLALALAIFLVISAAIVGSRFGKALTAVRDAESRMRFLGYRVERYKLFVFVLSAAMAGIAGALYVPQVGIINPSEFAPGNSIEAVLWVAVGGRGTLIGPVIGAFLVNFGKTWLTGALPEVWLFALGALFIVVTLLLPKGVVGLWNQFMNRSRERRARAAA